jgi:hypothetical protein
MTTTNATTRDRNPMQNLSRAMQVGESFLDNVSDTIESAVEGIQGVGASVRREFKPASVLPIALGSFAVGVAAGILGTLYFPKMRDSEFVGTLGQKLASARNVVADSLMSAKSSVGETFSSAMKAVKDATVDLSAKGTVGNNGTTNPSRPA